MSGSESTGDPRSRRIAVVAEALLAERLPALRDEGFGVMQLPPAGLAPATAAAWLEQMAEQIAEYERHGYEVVLLDDGTSGDELEQALARAGRRPLARLSRPSIHRRRAG